MLKNIWALIKRFLGFPPEATEEQKNEKLITMREDRDCHVAAIATACGVSYEKASKALWHWNLPGLLESPILSNPINLQRGIKKLGFDIRSTRISEVLMGELVPGKVICLMHDPSSTLSGILAQHWVVWMGRDEGNQHLFHWCKEQRLRCYSEADTVGMLTSGWPNAIYSVVDSSSQQG